MLQRIFGHHVDFFSDRVCRIYSVLVFVLVAVILASELAKPDVITCFTPAQFADSHNAYARKVCNNGANLWLPHDGNLPQREDYDGVKYDHAKMKYLPLVLFCQSLLFLLPWLFWRIMSSNCCSLGAVVRDAHKASTAVDIGVVSCELKKLTESSATSAILNISYIVMKMLYGIMCLLQMAILQGFLGINFFTYNTVKLMYSLQDIQNLTVANDQPLIPKVVMCDFQMRQLGRQHDYVIQCTVEIGDLVERCLYVIWIWLVFVVVITAVSGMFSFFKSIFWFIGATSYSESYVRRKLERLPSFQAVPKHTLSKFVKLNMKPGLFLALEIIDENGSLIGKVGALSAIWEDFLYSSKIGSDDAVMAIPSTHAYPTTYDAQNVGRTGTQAPLLGQEEISAGGPYYRAHKQLEDVGDSQM